MVPPMPAGLSFHGISKRFSGPWVLDGISGHVACGRLTALLGHNGSGKSTLFKGLVGLHAFDAGQADLDGIDLLALPMHRKLAAGLAYLPQQVIPFEELSVYDDLMAIAEILPLPDDERRRRVDSALGRFSLTDLAQRPTGVLSGGESRRLAIAKVLLGRPRVLLLDEPFAGLDPRTVEDLGNLLRTLTADGLGILITDHQVHCTLALADDVYVLAAGRIVVHGPPAVVQADPVARESYFGRWFG